MFLTIIAFNSIMKMYAISCFRFKTLLTSISFQYFKQFIFFNNFFHENYNETLNPKKMYLQILDYYQTKVHPFLSSSFCVICKITDRQTKHLLSGFLAILSDLIIFLYRSISFLSFFYR